MAIFASLCFLGERDSGRRLCGKSPPCATGSEEGLSSTRYKVLPISRVRNRGGVNFASRRSQRSTYSAHEGYPVVRNRVADPWWRMRGDTVRPGLPRQGDESYDNLTKATIT